jgi:hypothetical protein
MSNGVTKYSTAAVPTEIILDLCKEDPFKKCTSDMLNVNTQGKVSAAIGNKESTRLITLNSNVNLIIYYIYS